MILDDFPNSGLLDPNIVDNPKPVEIINVNRAAILCFLICLSPVYYGYSLTIIGASNLDTLVSHYSIGIAISTALALMNGALPIGGMLGCIIFPKLRQLASKKKLHYYLSMCSLIVCGVSVLPSFPVLVVCRFVLGIISAQYMALSINLIKEHFPDQYWKPYGAVYSAMRIMGILMTYIIGQMFQGGDQNVGNTVIAFGPAFISVMQAVAIGYNLPDSPVELLRKNQTVKAAEALELLYSKQDSQKRLNQLRLKIKRSVPSKYDTITNNPLNVGALHLAILRQFNGVTYLVVYASQIHLHTQFALGNSAVVIENCIQMMGGLIGVVFVMKFSRYDMITVSTVVLLIVNISIGISSVINIPWMGFTSICIFMFICGSMLTSSAWAWPAQLATPGIERYVAVASMGGTAIISIVPPFVVAAMPDGRAYPIFFFFALYMVVASILNPYLLPRDDQQSQGRQIQLALGA